MAGVQQWNIGGSRGGAPAGHRWDPTRGGYVAISALEDEQRRRQAEANADADRLRRQRMEDTDRALANSGNADATRRQYMLDQQENQRRLDELDRENRGRLDILGATGGSAGGEGGGSGGGGGEAPAPVTGPVPGSTPAAGPSEAERGFYTRAKENTGRSMSAALRGLQNMMQRRGISGSGIEAKGLSDLFAAGSGELAETDRQLAEGGAQRAWEAGEAEKGRAWQSGENRLSRTQQATNSRLQALLQFYGTRY